MEVVSILDKPRTCFKMSVCSADPIPFDSCVTNPSWLIMPHSDGIEAYMNPQVVSRFARKKGISLKKSEKIFTDVKEFLLNSSHSTRGFEPPSFEVDQMWHNFILFTKDYAEFCTKYVGRFVHHIPYEASSGCTSDQGGSQDNGGMDCSSCPG